MLKGDIGIIHVKTEDQLADIFTKILDEKRFSALRCELNNLDSSNIQSSGEDVCKARYAILFQIRTFLPEPEVEAHIGPTATYDEVIYPVFQHDITALQIQGYNISYNRHTSA